MQFQILSIFLALLVAFATAAAPQKAIVVSFEDPNTPQSAVDAAMQAIKDAGGIITHEYTLLKGFAAKASDKAIEAVHALANEYVPIVEDDIVYTVQGGQ